MFYQKPSQIKMKTANILFQLTLIIFLSSCVNPQKLLEKGDYDRAFTGALNRLKSSNSNQNEVDKETLIKALEGIWQKDSTNIARLSDSSTEKDWDKAIDLNQKLRKKLDKAQPYTRAFDSRYNDLIELENGFREEIFIFYKSRGLEDIEKFDLAGKKVIAQSAYNNFQKALEYGTDLETDSLSNAMFNKGVVNYQVDVSTRLVFGIFDSEIDRIFDDIDSYSRGFRRIFFERPMDDVDCVMEIVLHDLDFDLDESSSTDKYERRVEDGYETKVDTSGQEIQIPKYINVSGSITTTTFRKKGSFRVEVNIRSKSDNCNLTGADFWTELEDVITEEIREGDERALPNDSSSIFTEELRDDDEMAEEMAINLYNQVVDYYF